MGYEKENHKNKNSIKHKLKRIYAADVVLKFILSLVLIFLLVNSFKIIKQLEIISGDYNEYFKEKLTVIEVN